MTVQVEAPTGREVREHLERWEALPEGERPWPLERWDEVEQGWAVAGIYDRGLRYDDDTPQPGLRLVPLPQPETERVPWWEAVGRTHVSGSVVDTVRATVEGAVVRGRDGAALATAFSANGTVEVLVEPGSATPATDSDPTSAVASSERASEVVGGGGGAGATTPTRPDPPEGWVVCRDREILRAADERRMVRWWCGSWSDPLGGWDYDARYIDDDRYAVPVSMVPAEPWTPQVGDRVLVEAVVVAGPLENMDGGMELDVAWPSGESELYYAPPSALRPFPEDGA